MPSIESAEMSSPRLFFALWPDAPTRDALLQAQQALAVTGGRPLHPLDLHITLAFLGQVPPEQLPCVLAAADRIEAPSLAFTLSRQGVWRGPRVAWVAPEPSPLALSDLVDQLWRQLGGCGYRPEPRPYQAHVTLLRKARMVDEAPLASAIPWVAHEFVLAASLPGPAVPRYEIRQRWALSNTPR